MSKDKQPSNLLAAIGYTSSLIAPGLNFTAGLLLYPKNPEIGTLILGISIYSLIASIIVILNTQVK